MDHIKDAHVEHHDHVFTSYDSIIGFFQALDQMGLRDFLDSVY